MPSPPPCFTNLQQTEANTTIIRRKRSRDDDMKNLIKQNLTNEAVQGFFKIFFSSSRTIKLFWTLSLIIGNALNAYLVISSIVTYLSFGVSTHSNYLVHGLLEHGLGDVVEFDFLLVPFFNKKLKK